VAAKKYNLGEGIIRRRLWLESQPKAKSAWRRHQRRSLGINWQRESEEIYDGQPSAAYQAAK